MSAAVQEPEPRTPRREDQRVFLHGVSWDGYETLLRIRGESSGVRMTYLEGELELMSPSVDHEWIKKTLARLLEAYTEEQGLELTGLGSWTVKNALRERGVEPDECYVLGSNRRPDAPDLAIEVIWTHGGLDKLEVYRGLGVGEVWLWRDGAVEVHVLDGERYQRRERSALLPGLDLDHLVSFLDEPSQPRAVRAYRESLRR